MIKSILISGLTLIIAFIFRQEKLSVKMADQNQQDSLNKKEELLATPGLVAFWDFKESAGKARLSVCGGPFPLTEQTDAVERINEGLFSGYAARFTGKNYLSLPGMETGALNIHGTKASVTVLAWIRWRGQGTGFIGGLWNEYQDGGKRQYGLFVNLPHYNGKDQVCGHISLKGSATPPFPYSIDYSASPQQVPPEQWECIGFTYDGTHIRSFFRGECIAREPELIHHTIGFEGYPDGLIQQKNPYYYPDGMGNNGSDFTVGAVQLKSGMGNFFAGDIAGLAVFNRALLPSEMKSLAR